MSSSEPEYKLHQLRAWRKAVSGMTQVRLARCMGVTQGFISQCERGGNTMSLSNATKAATCLGIELVDLLRDPNDLSAPTRATIKEAPDYERLAEAISLMKALSKDEFAAVYALIKFLGSAPRRPNS